MGKTDDPSKLFEKIASIKNAFQTNKQTVDEEDLLATVLKKASEEYASILATEERTKGANLTLENLEAAMDTEYRIRYGVKGTEREKKKRGELSLSAFNGICYNCQREGHLARDCPKRIKTNVLVIKEGANLREPAIIAASTATRRPTAGNSRRTKIKGRIDIKGSQRRVSRQLKVKRVGERNFC